MNPINLFKYLEKQKGKPIPFKVKLIHGLPLTPDELNVKGDLFLHDTNITSLPQGLKVGGSLSLRFTKIKFLPQGLKVGGYLNLENTPITSLPSDLQVGGSLWIKGTPLAQKSDREIRSMLKKFLSKTGYIKGRIHRV
jgi:hypothetical protein